MEISIEEFLGKRRTYPVIDVRSPGEFMQGHIPGAYNIPLFTDAERSEVGTLYVQEGHTPAVEHGLQIVGPKMVQLAREAQAQGGELCLYCWRGGMRSGSMEWLFNTVGIKTWRLQGGYKAYRAHFDHILNNNKYTLRILGGPTGSGKTLILHQLCNKGEQVVDLEGLANHKGSIFGGLGQAPQPTTEQYINLLHDAFIDMDPHKPIWLENESKLVGHVFIPDMLWTLMRSSRPIIIDIPVEPRAQHIFREYGSIDPLLLIEALGKIEKRMGNLLCTQAIEHVKSGDILSAIRDTLVYYDKAYQRSFDKQGLPPLLTIKGEKDDPESLANELIRLTQDLVDR
ncbi:tRNA 2-selenouridine(34) synthase MnmH [Porphyromonas pogonae]|uniref:tRNA 2-selenouridine(34) synthase MnmH n=1 Tax=Porphyromonas pogonae TaxID=867595 RepID=UPI002E777EB1|nr:tRNA 2-selenouridine(34) synthase MnmH [Porphyromonas pogonae]